MNVNTTDIYYLMARETLASGGGTFERDAYRHKKLPNRYVVALGGSFSRKISANLGSAAVPAIVKALRELSDMRSVWTPEHGLGTWATDDVVYVDIVESYSNLHAALDTARIRDELAIWDQVEQVEIPVPPVAEPRCEVCGEPLSAGHTHKPADDLLVDKVTEILDKIHPGLV